MVFLIIAIVAILLLIITTYYENKTWWRKYDKSPFNFPLKYKGRTIWHSRACAVTLFVFCKDKLGEWHILANKRGEGCPDFKGCWNVINGYLSFNETAEDCAIRECQEECGINLNNENIQFYDINSKIDSNKQNVVIYYYAKLDNDCVESLPPCITNQGEKNEVAETKWIPIDSITDYEWAFSNKTKAAEIFKAKIQGNI